MRHGGDAERRIPSYSRPLGSDASRTGEPIQDTFVIGRLGRRRVGHGRLVSPSSYSNLNLARPQAAARGVQQKTKVFECIND